MTSPANGGIRSVFHGNGTVAGSREISTGLTEVVLAGVSSARMWREVVGIWRGREGGEEGDGDGDVDAMMEKMIGTIWWCSIFRFSVLVRFKLLTLDIWFVLNKQLPLRQLCFDESFCDQRLSYCRISHEYSELSSRPRGNWKTWFAIDFLALSPVICRRLAAVRNCKEKQRVCPFGVCGIYLVNEWVATVFGSAVS